jgi:recombination protein RecR
MDFKSKLLNDAVEQMSSLPGIGKRSALRLVLHLLDQSEKEVKDFTQAFLSLKEHLNFCSECYHITEQKMCEICRNPSRSEELICVVQDIRDLLAIESTQQFYGKYHVLGGVISPMDGIGPNDLKINELKERIVKESTKEIILALPATMEGDTTNFYLYRKLQETNVNITLISRGIGVGNQLEYIDELTLGKSLLDRSVYKTNITNK